MVTLTVAAILLGIGIPSFQGFIATQKVKTAAFDVTSSMVLARSEALKRNTDVTIAPDTAGAWAGGWTVKAGATLILQQQAFTGVTVTRAPADSAIPASFTYKSTGRVTASPVDVKYLQINASPAVRCVKIDATGIPSTQSVACP